MAECSTWNFIHTGQKLILLHILAGVFRREVLVTLGLNIFYSEGKDWARHTT